MHGQPELDISDLEDDGDSGDSGGDAGLSLRGANCPLYDYVNPVVT